MSKTRKPDPESGERSRAFLPGPLAGAARLPLALASIGDSPAAGSGAEAVFDAPLAKETGRVR